MGHMVKSLAVGLGFFRILAEAPHFHNAQQHRQADFVDGLGEIRYIQRFDNIVGTAKFPATVDGFLVVGGRQHDHRNSPQFGIGLDLTENLNAVNLGHPDIQQQKVGLVQLAVGGVTLLEQVIQCLLAVPEVKDTGSEAHTEEILLDEREMPKIILGNENIEFLFHGRISKMAYLVFPLLNAEGIHQCFAGSHSFSLLFAKRPQFPHSNVGSPAKALYSPGSLRSKP